MHSPWQSQRARGEAGDPLPSVWKAFEARDIRFRRGQLVLISAGPGTGKSAFTLNYAVQAKVPALYVSADSDSFTQLARMISVLTGRTLKDSAQLILDDRLAEVREELQALPIQWSYESSPSLGDIEAEVSAYEEVFGSFPDLIVVDNISNVRADTEDDSVTAGQDAVMEYLHTMARATGSCVMGLHHVTSSHNDGDKPIPLSGVKNQISDKPEMVLTLTKRMADDWNSTDVLRVAPVKNRAGKPDPSGQTAAELEFDGARMQIRDLEGV